jgi:hypothetical protein
MANATDERPAARQMEISARCDSNFHSGPEQGWYYPRNEIVALDCGECMVYSSATGGRATEPARAFAKLFAAARREFQRQMRRPEGRRYESNGEGGSREQQSWDFNFRRGRLAAWW